MDGCKGCQYHATKGCKKDKRGHSPNKSRGGCSDACNCDPCRCGKKKGGCCGGKRCSKCDADPCMCRTRERGCPCGGRGCRLCIVKPNGCNVVCVTNPNGYLVSPPYNINLRYITLDNATYTPVCIEIRKCPQRCEPIYCSPKFGLPLGQSMGPCNDNGNLRYGEPCCNTYKDFGIAPAPPIHLGPGESKTVGVNSIGEDMQLINIVCPSTGQLLGPPATLQTNANSFVIYDTCGVFHTSSFYHAGYRASF